MELKIYTTIDSRMQKYAEEAMVQHLRDELQPTFFKHWKWQPNAPFVFDPAVADEETKNVLDQAMRRSDRYRQLKEEGVPADSIKMIFNTPDQNEGFFLERPGRYDHDPYGFNPV